VSGETPAPGRSGESSDEDDPVTRNRAAPARATPDRAPVGADVTTRLRRITGAALLIATLVLAAVVVVGRLS